MLSSEGYKIAEMENRLQNTDTYKSLFEKTIVQTEDFDFMYSFIPAKEKEQLLNQQITNYS